MSTGAYIAVIYIFFKFKTIVILKPNVNMYAPVETKHAYIYSESALVIKRLHNYLVTNLKVCMYVYIYDQINLGFHGYIYTLHACVCVCVCTCLCTPYIMVYQTE